MCEVGYVVTDECVCRLRVRFCISKTTAELHQFLRMSTVAVAWSSSGGIAICYVLPVLYMTSCFQKWALWRFVCTCELNELPLVPA